MEYVVYCAAKEVPLGDDRERTDQTLIHSTPDDGVYRTGLGGGGSIVDTFGERVNFGQEQNGTRNNN